MKIVDAGSGPPIVIVPGIQGRWEWIRPGVEALARSCRVVTFSLADERTCGGRFDERRGFACYVDQVHEAMDQAGLSRAAVCGVSYGGLIAAAFAAAHAERTSALVLVSAISPSWSPDARAQFYLRAPRLLSPIFCVTSPLRLHREVAAAVPNLGQRLGVSARNGWNVVTHLFSPARMARRIHLLRQVDIRDSLTRIRVPTLLVTGEPHLDCVVPVRVTHEYLQLIPHAEQAVLERTGHIGIMTRPTALAALVAPFVQRAAQGRGARRRIG